MRNVSSLQSGSISYHGLIVFDFQTNGRVFQNGKSATATMDRSSRL